MRPYSAAVVVVGHQVAAVVGHQVAAAGAGHNDPPGSSSTLIRTRTVTSTPLHAVFLGQSLTAPMVSAVVPSPTASAGTAEATVAATPGAPLWRVQCEVDNLVVFKRLLRQVDALDPSLAPAE